MFSKRLDFLAVGDITTDAFIKLKEAHMTCDVNHEHCTISMKFGDKIPYESVDVVRAVGNSANAAVAAARLGLRSALAADVGMDQNGRECLASLRRDRVGTRFVSIHRGMETNYHYVLWYDVDRTILVKHQEFPYRLPRLGSGGSAPKWIYLSSLAGNSYEYHVAITNWLAKNPNVKLAFQPGTFQMELGVEKLAELYRRTDVFYCNKEEAQRILKTDEEDVKRLMSAIRALGPRIAVITDGPAGAYADDGATAYFMPPYPDPRPPYERTGAGDAFSSTMTIALALGKTLEEALMWGPINAASVVQHIGAQKGLLSRAELESWLAKAPADYRPKKL